VTSREAALRLTNEASQLTTGVLYAASRPTLLDELSAIESQARGNAAPPTRGEFLRAFRPVA
jgi:hypothetical protein